jgi:DNA-binding NarL/FixJ family response regulator
MNPGDQTQRRTVFLVDDHPLVRDGLAQLINQAPDFRVCGEAEDATSAYAEINRMQPDAAIIDLSLRGGSGLDLIKRLQDLSHPPSILVLSMYDEAFYAERALRAGALGYVMKRETSGRVIGALRQIVQGKLFVSAAIASQAAEKFLRRRSSASAVDCLTDREIEMFRRIGQGQENRHIAGELGLSLKTVQAHCANIKQKLGLDNATVLMREAVKWVEGQR